MPSASQLTAPHALRCSLPLCALCVQSHARQVLLLLDPRGHSTLRGVPCCIFLRAIGELGDLFSFRREIPRAALEYPIFLAEKGWEGKGVVCTPV